MWRKEFREGLNPTGVGLKQGVSPDTGRCLNSLGISPPAAEQGLKWVRFLFQSEEAGSSVCVATLRLRCPNNWTVPSSMCAHTTNQFRARVIPSRPCRPRHTNHVLSVYPSKHCVRNYLQWLQKLFRFRLCCRPAGVSDHVGYMCASPPFDFAWITLAKNCNSFYCFIDSAIHLVTEKRSWDA
jgi:hypothetical protein